MHREVGRAKDLSAQYTVGDDISAVSQLASEMEVTVLTRHMRMWQFNASHDHCILNLFIHRLQQTS